VVDHKILKLIAREAPLALTKTIMKNSLTELRGKLAGLGPCDHEAGICTGACELLDQIHAAEQKKGPEFSEGGDSGGFEKSPPRGS